MRIQIVIYFIYTLYIKNKLLACVTKVEQQKHKCKTKLKEKHKNTIYHCIRLKLFTWFGLHINYLSVFTHSTQNAEKKSLVKKCSLQLRHLNGKKNKIV